MDIKKDIQNRNALSPRVPNGMESFSISLSKKSERLATAMYLVTNFLSDTEPLKSRLRTLSLELVRDASSVRYGATATEANVLDGLRANIGETLGLLELALIAGLVSEMNFSILKREYASLRDAVEIKKASRESRTDTVLGDTFFGSSFSAPELPTKTTIVAQNILTKPEVAIESKGHSIGQKETTMSLRMSDRPTKKFSTQGSVKGQVKDAVLAATQTVEKSSRRARIIKLIKDNREVSIKDIILYFPELSEKTIQREIVSLTTEGVLKKSGERRWSRYAIA